MSWGMKFDIAFTSDLQRAQKTCQHILDGVGQSDLETIRDLALNERDYGDLSGLNKDDARVKWGEEQVHIWRRSYDVPPPRRREPERHRGAHIALLHHRSAATSHVWQNGLVCRSRQLAALYRDGFGPFDKRRNSGCEFGNRYPNDLQIQRRYQHCFQRSHRALKTQSLFRERKGDKCHPFFRCHCYTKGHR